MNFSKEHAIRYLINKFLKLRDWYDNSSEYECFTADMLKSIGQSDVPNIYVPVKLVDEDNEIVNVHLKDIVKTVQLDLIQVIENIRINKEYSELLEEMWQPLPFGIPHQTQCYGKSIDEMDLKYIGPVTAIEINLDEELFDLQVKKWEQSFTELVNRFLNALNDYILKCSMVRHDLIPVIDKIRYKKTLDIYLKKKEEEDIRELRMPDIRNHIFTQPQLLYSFYEEEKKPNVFVRIINKLKGCFNA